MGGQNVCVCIGINGRQERGQGLAETINLVNNW